jgi:hypothetical protein
MEQPKAGDVYVVSIGLDYQNNNSADDLRGTLYDAREVFRALQLVTEKNGQTWHGYLLVQEGASSTQTTFNTYEGEGVDKVNYASKEHVLKTLRTIRDQADANDLTIFTYSGHGVLDTGELVLGYTGVNDDSYLFHPNELLDELAAIPGRKLFILDSCYSGMFVTESPSSLSTVYENSLNDWYAKYWQQNQYKVPDVMALTASAHTDSYEQVFAATHIHGIFTAALLQALGWDPAVTDPSSVTNLNPFVPARKEGQLTVDGLYTYIKDHQDAPLRSLWYWPQPDVQHPMTTGGALDMVLFHF